MTKTMRYTALAALCAFGPVGQAAAQSANYSPAKVIAAMKRADPKLKIVVSHRGKYGHMCPENSICAINNAISAGSEAIEIDVKETQDGVPWPSHDLTIGRGTTYTLNGVYFYPYRYYDANERNNPALSSKTSRELLVLKLRDKDGYVTSYNNQSLYQLLAQSSARNNNVVYIFDIKFPQSVKKVATMVKSLGIADASILKFSATFFQPFQVYQETLGVAFAPTLYAPQMDEIAERHFLQKPNYTDRVYSYMDAFAFVKGFTYYELGNKMFERSGQFVVLSGPMEPLTRRLRGAGRAISNFIPVIEHRPDSRSPMEGFYHTDGHCCTRLIDFLAKTKHFGNELRDDRPDMQMQVLFNDSVITDDAMSASSFAQSFGGRRNLPLIMR